VADELPLRDQDQLMKERELRLKELEITAKERELKTSKWLNPVGLGLLAAAFGFAGSIVVTLFNNSNTEKIERSRAQSTLILESIKTNGAPDSVCSNLTFFVKLGLLDDSSKAIAGTCPANTYGVPSLPAGTNTVNPTGIASVKEKTTVMVQDEKGNVIPDATVTISYWSGATLVHYNNCKTATDGQCTLPVSRTGELFTIAADKDGYTLGNTFTTWSGSVIIILHKKAKTSRH
jgi:hypothetical protein